MNIKMVGGNGIPHTSDLFITDNEGNNINKKIKSIDISIKPNNVTTANVVHFIDDLELEGIIQENVYVDTEGNKYKRIEEIKKIGEVKIKPIVTSKGTHAINFKTKLYD